MKLKILHVGKYYSPYTGGIETVVKDLCEGLAVKGHDVRVICSNTKNENSEDITAGVKVYRYAQVLNLNSLPLSPKLWLEIQRHSKWADIIHIHSPNPVCEIFASFIPRDKILASTHHSDIYKQKFFKLLLKPFWWYFKKRLDQIIVPTDNHITYSDMINSEKDKCTIIPFGINDIEESKNPSPFLIENKIEKYILFVGRIVDYKGLPYLIEAMKNIDCKLVIVGQGPAMESLEKLDGRVYFTGRVESQQELDEIYRSAYCFVLPSITKNENFGVVQLEAMAHGLPVITTNLKSGVPRVGIPGKTSILVSPRSSKELSQAIQKLLDAPDLAKQMGEAGRDLFLKKYTLEMMINAHINLYLRLFNGK